MFRAALLVMVLLLSPLSSMAQAPAFATQTPLQGNSGTSFFVFLPVANVGSGDAKNIELTSAALTLLGSPVAQLKVPSALPHVVGFAAPTGVQTLNLEFDNTRLISGDRYLLKISGTYQSGGTTFGFALNRFITYSKGFAVAHEQVLQVITAKFDSLPGADAQADDQAILSFIQGLPQVSSAGLQVDPPLVWVNFNDGGERLDILNNVKLPAVPFLTPPAAQAMLPKTKSEAVTAPTRALAVKAAAVAAGSPTELPQSRQVRIVSSMGSGFYDAAPDIKLWLIIHGYDPATDADASLDSLRNVGGDGVFYISAHGGIDKEEQSLRVRTSTLENPKCNKDLPGFNADLCSDPLLTEDINEHRVIVTTAKEKWNPLTEKWTSEDHYSIDKKFVDKWWAFGTNSLVYIDTCHSNQADPNVLAFKNEVFSKGASVYAGWTEAVGSEASADTARLVFERLLGANMFCPETGAAECGHGPAIPPAFAQRPFDYTQVATDLPLHHLGTDTNPAANLKFDANGSFGLLAPSISNMVANEIEGQNGQLFINGSFGADPRGGSGGGTNGVTVGGQNANIVNWSPTLITVDLAESGAGAAGDVTVTVRDHKSNVARLTEWHGTPFTYTITGAGSEKINATFDLHFRTDIRKYRPAIHNEPIEPTGGFVNTADTGGNFSMSGQSTANGVTYRWSGSGTFVGVSLNIPITGLNVDEVAGTVVDSKHLKVNVSSFSEANAGGTCTESTSTPPPTINKQPVDGPGNLVALIGDSGSRSFDFLLDDSGVIQKSSFGAQGKGSFRSYFCMDSSQTANYNFVWGPLAPTNDTAPDPTSAR
jgi:hypothetical protein